MMSYNVDFISKKRQMIHSFWDFHCVWHIFRAFRVAIVSVRELIDIFIVHCSLMSFQWFRIIFRVARTPTRTAMHDPTFEWQTSKGLHRWDVGIVAVFSFAYFDTRKQWELFNVSSSFGCSNACHFHNIRIVRPIQFHACVVCTQNVERMLCAAVCLFDKRIESMTYDISFNCLAWRRAIWVGDRML